MNDALEAEGFESYKARMREIDEQLTWIAKVAGKHYSEAGEMEPKVRELLAERLKILEQRAKSKP